MTFDLPRITASGLVASIDFHELLGSTSDRALELAAQGDSLLPLLVLTELQSGGRGRGTSRWWSAEGALTFSLALETPAVRLSPDQWPQLSLAAGLAVCQTLEEFLPRMQCQVKWPNDVYLQGGKVCGILCESVPGWRDRLVVGIGLNVNNSLTDLPDGVPKSARSMCDVTGQNYDRTAILLSVLDNFDERWRQLSAGHFLEIAVQYRQRCFLTGRTLTIATGQQTLVGRCLGIDDDGALLLQTESGARRVIAGTIVAWDDW